MTSSLGDSSALLRLGSWCVAVASGRVYDLAARRLVRTVDHCAEALLVKAGARVLIVHADLRELVASDLRTGEIVWRATVPFVSGLSVIHCADRALVALREVKKYGPGERLFFDAHTGLPASERDLGLPVESRKEQGRWLGDSNVSTLFAWLGEGAVRVHRSSDGAVVARGSLALPAASASTTKVTEDGAKVTEYALDFSAPVDRVFFAEREALLCEDRALRCVDAEGRALFSCAIDAGATVVGASCHDRRWYALIARGRGRVAVAELSSAGCKVLWEERDAIAIVDDHFVTSRLEFVRIATGEVSFSLPIANPSLRTERVAGPLVCDPSLLDLLVRIRACAKDKRPPGASLTAVQALEAKWGREIPNWALTVLAANSATLERRWGVSLAKIDGYQDELRDAERLHMSWPKQWHWQSDPVPFPSGLVVIGRKNEQSLNRRKRMRTDETTWWCARGDECFLVRDCQTWRVNDSLVNDALDSRGWFVQGPVSPGTLLAEVLEALQSKTASHAALEEAARGAHEAWRWTS